MRKSWIFLSILLAIMLLAACGGGTEESAAPEEAATPAADTGKKVDPATAGNIAGKVAYMGEAPKAARLRMGADAACAEQHSSPVYSEDVIVNENGTLANAFVYVKSGLEGYTFDAPSGKVTLDQQGCVYRPHVLGVRTGQELEVLNSDDTTHNINPSPTNNRNWNESQGPNAPPKIKTFARAEVAIPVKCNVHPWMKAYIAVVDHPYYQVTGDDGSFELKGLPPGEYTVEVWHEKFGASEMKVTVAQGGTAEANFEIGA